MQTIITCLFLIFITYQNESMMIFDFESNSNLSNWFILDDVVMGGRSDGHFEINEKGHGQFYGDVSLENYGGFSSVRYNFQQKEVQSFAKCRIRLKGDGKAYQFRVKSNSRERHSYIQSFETTGEWQDVEIDLRNMYPSFRGRKLRIPNYPCEYLEEIAFLIGNKKNESFKLEIDNIVLE